MNVVGSIQQDTQEALRSAGLMVTRVSLPFRTVRRKDATGKWGVEYRISSTLPDISELFLFGLYNKNVFVWEQSWVDMYNECTSLNKGNVTSLIYYMQYDWWGDGKLAYMQNPQTEQYLSKVVTLLLPVTFTEEIGLVELATSYHTVQPSGGCSTSKYLLLVPDLHSLQMCRVSLDLIQLPKWDKLQVRINTGHIPFGEFDLIITVGAAGLRVPKASNVHYYPNIKSIHTPARRDIWQRIANKIV